MLLAMLWMKSGWSRKRSAKRALLRHILHHPISTSTPSLLVRVGTRARASSAPARQGRRQWYSMSPPSGGAPVRGPLTMADPRAPAAEGALWADPFPGGRTRRCRTARATERAPSRAFVPRCGANSRCVPCFPWCQDFGCCSSNSRRVSCKTSSAVPAARHAIVQPQSILPSPGRCRCRGIRVDPQASTGRPGPRRHGDLQRLPVRATA